MQSKNTIHTNDITINGASLFSTHGEIKTPKLGINFQNGHETNDIKEDDAKVEDPSENWREFISNTTFHGIRYVFLDGSFKIRR